MLNNQVKTTPIRWIPSVYFAMGLPFVTLSLVSILIFEDMGIKNDKIAFWTSLLLLPWSLKPIFSILMEAFGNKRQYIIYTEVITAIMFGIISVLLPIQNTFGYILIFMGIIAISGSVHDIAGDGIYMEQLTPQIQSLYSGWQGAFYNIAKVLANGVLVFVAGWLTKYYQIQALQSWQIIIATLAIIMASAALYHITVLPTSPPKTEAKKEKWRIFKEVFISFFQKKYIFLYLIFIFLYRFAEGLAMKIAPLFLVAPIAEGGIALDKEQYGIAYGTFGAISFILGSILAGYYLSRFGLKKTLFHLVCAFNIPFIVFLLLAIYQPNSFPIVATGIIFEYFGYGFGFVGLTIFMMQQIAPGKHAMAHYAFANSLMNLGVLIPGMISGYLSEWLGYKNFFLLVMIMTIPALIITKFIPFTYNDSKK